MAAKKQTLEKTLVELETIVKRLEEGDLDLEESIKLYERGVSLTAQAKKMLDDAKLRITELSELPTEESDEAL